MTPLRDHGGGIDAAIAQFGGTRDEWLDLSTGINPMPYTLPTFSQMDWATLPDKEQFKRLEHAARAFWNIPPEAAVLAGPGASAFIARIPHLSVTRGAVHIIDETYNEHAAAFRAAGWCVELGGKNASVTVHPNNPTASFVTESDIPQTPLTIIDESFCDIAPDQSHIAKAAEAGTIILKSFGKFWGLAGLRLGFAIGDPALIAELRETLGPWQVSGPALATGIAALSDHNWAQETRARLRLDAQRMDDLMAAAGAKPKAGTTLFQIYEVDNAQQWQERFASHKILTRIFPYSDKWLRLGLPASDRWPQLEAAL
ncbi:aminotransferase class I/II-fold pyridoxal phosphate-dependent enzyme [Falsihalocynthiibacter sp. SS001]|uniref:aminotransferase class I/II-fold pyridoxal phosphate-dependent enzyme n=1 Tax=Falsihalocynthiibacter sp. SS001 TaxID=3349698 RepID=UPI0036D34204